MKKAFLVIFLVLFIDQALKFYIKTHFFLGEEYPVFGKWFIIHFTENNGMAFGMEIMGRYGKLILSLFRIVAAVGILWYLFYLSKKHAPTNMIIGFAMICAGALGNIIDSFFYGMLFNDSSYQVAEFLPSAGGYAGILYGKVVDMLYFPVIEGHFPSWFPFWGTEEFIFFRPVFNVADASITLGVAVVILFQKDFFHKTQEQSE